MSIPFTGSATILGRREFIEALGNLPGRVAKKVMDEWTFRQASNLAKAARASAPRDRTKPRNKPESLRMWRQIRASRVKRLQKFPGSVSRSIVYGAQTRGSITTRLSAARAKRALKRNARRQGARKSKGPVGYHFNIVASTTANMRRQKTTGKNTGRMWTNTANTRFWQRVTERGLANAQGEVGALLRNAYDAAMQREINRIMKKA